MSNANNSNPVFATSFLLLVQYGGRAVIPIIVRKDYSPHLVTEVLVREISCGEISLPLVRMEDSKKTARGVHLSDLALYIDARVAAASRHYAAL
jgi:Pyocin activator protein PrtN